MSAIEHLDAWEILDSRGRPTIEVSCRLASGSQASAQVPSGASTGKAEALELRDGDPMRHGGLGCLRAAANVRQEIAQVVVAREFRSQEELDRVLLGLDGTPDKSRLGANALLGVSLAFARATAQERGVPLYRHFAELVGIRVTTLPRLTINLFSGGRHAGGQVAIQDVLLVPRSMRTISDALAASCGVYRAAAQLTESRYSARALVADEGGLAPSFPSARQMLEDAVEAIHKAGFEPGQDFDLAVDVASSHFFDGNDGYLLDGRRLDAQKMIETLKEWIQRFPLCSVEDGLSEEAWSDWNQLLKEIGDRRLVMGDDLLCTNPTRIRRAISENSANALLLKVNQVGTLTEAAEARHLARSAGWHITISARSGETEDDWLSDLAVGWGGDFIKVGSITRSERLAKYNRLLEIERETELSFVPWQWNAALDN